MMNRRSCSSLLIAVAVCAITSSVHADLLTSFSDDFNRPDSSSLGSNYTPYKSTPNFSLSNNAVLNTAGNESLEYLNLGTLPTAADFASGFSYTASIDIWVPTATTDIPAVGILLNMQHPEDTSTLEYGGIYIAGRAGGAATIRYSDRAPGKGQQTLTGPSITIADANIWYTLSITATSVGSWTYDWREQGASTSLNSGTLTLNPASQTAFEGGYIGFYNDSTPHNGAYQWDNFSVNVTSIPEPATLALCAVSMGALFFARRKFRGRSRKW